MPNINDPRKVYDAQTGETREWSPRLRPQTSNADEWALWLEEHADYGIPFKAVQIAEALDDMHRGVTNYYTRGSAHAAASAMLATLKDLARFAGPSPEFTTKASKAAIWETALAAIAQAEASGIKAES